jgi:winged helix DNA-binding protein
VPYWFVPSAPPPRAPSPTVHLLQAYDEYIMGYRESKFILDASGVTGSRPQGRAVFNHIVILDGHVAGHWKRTLHKGSVTIEAALYEPFDDAQTMALQAAAARHGQFLGLTAAVTTTEL